MRSASRLLLPIVVLAACAPSGAASSDTAAAKVDLAAEEQAIRDRDAQRLRAISAKDTAAIADHYATDALFMPPNAQALGGRPGVIKGWTPALEWPAGALRATMTRVEVARSGDLAYGIGSYTVSYDGPKGRVEDKGKHVVVWKKENGQWKITADIFNSDLPVKR